VEVLLEYIEEHAKSVFPIWLSDIAAALAAEDEAEKESEVPVEHTTQLAAFFDRDLALQHLDLLVEVTPAHENDCFTLYPDKEYYYLLEDLLAEGLPVQELPDNAIIGGFYCTYPSGDTAMFMVVNGDRAGKPYVDAVLVLAPGTHRDVPNISLPPRYKLLGDYTFDYPDAAPHTVRLAAQ
jgi:hypothetical protein